MEKQKLTDRQKEILECIKKNLQEKGYPPTVRELCAMSHQKSTANVHTILNILEKKGYIRRDPTKQRAIEIIQDHPENATLMHVPLISSFDNEMDYLDDSNVISYIGIPADCLPDGIAFMVKAGDSGMEAENILKGDLILVERDGRIDNGDIVVGWKEDVFLVRRMDKENGVIYAAGNDVKPVTLADCRIVGKARGFFRIFS